MRVRIPRYLHLPVQILIFDMEDIGVIAAMYFLWLMVDNWVVLVLLVVVPMIFKSVKSRMPRGFLKHSAYRLGFLTTKDYPPTSLLVHHE